MSVLGLTKLAWDLEHEAGLVDQYSNEPAAVLNRYQLTEQQRQWVLDLDASALLGEGMNPVSLRNLLVQLGVPHGEMYGHQSKATAQQPPNGDTGPGQP